MPKLRAVNASVNVPVGSDVDIFISEHPNAEITVKVNSAMKPYFEVVYKDKTKRTVLFDITGKRTVASPAKFKSATAKVVVKTRKPISRVSLPEHEH